MILDAGPRERVDSEGRGRDNGGGGSRSGSVGRKRIIGEAVTYYRVLDYNDNASLVECRPETGGWGVV